MTGKTETARLLKRAKRADKAIARGLANNETLDKAASRVARIAPEKKETNRSASRLADRLKDSFRPEKSDQRNESLTFHEQLADLASLSGASRIIGVKLNSIQHAISNGKLPKYQLADGTPLVRISECKPLWPNGSPGGPGRPTLC